MVQIAYVDGACQYPGARATIRKSAMASKETIGAVAECFGEFEEFFNGMDNRVFGYADVTPEKLRILHARILLGDKLGSLVIPKNTTLKLGIACTDSDMYVTMLYSPGPFSESEQRMVLRSDMSQGEISEGQRRGIACFENTLVGTY